MCWTWEPVLRCRLSKGAHLTQGNPRGSGFLNGEQMGRDGNEEISLRATWDQGGRILSQQGGFQVSKGN